MKFKQGSKVKIKYPENVLEILNKLSWSTQVFTDFDVNKVYTVSNARPFIDQDSINFGYTLGYKLHENKHWAIPDKWLVPANVITEEEKNKIRELLNKI